MSRQTLRILCFGDSLTSGYFEWGTASHPYALKLEDRLTGAFPHVDVEVVVDGVPGDVATFDRFYKRFTNAWQKKSYDWAIVLAGTNDIAYGIPSDDIFTALADIYDVALSRERNILALTVPECMSKAERSTTARNELNQSILDNKDTNYYAFDLHAHIPYHSLSEQDRAKYWDDGVHLRDDGYDWMGNHIANALIDILRREGTLEPASSAPPEDLLDDDFSFDEEDGNPRNIHEGYVVVRKKDLY
ncbi:hypothetical protein FZEAL_55 [Fusarium zealandicum]|uniref:SGNH hydrolase-type esterase domain-containing protein n=1 Tax=Fusarium zealandicum TaxID=1053134 RepID=A0A8H4UW15_9HYPO|nr:hypothetical protein FZEAL_55 [Fusarium zealandicum]